MLKKNLLPALCWITMQLSCSYQVVEPEINLPVPVENIQTGIIRLGEVRELRVPEAIPGSRDTEFVWTAAKVK
jgi:hypothetical protein